MTESLFSHLAETNVDKTKTKAKTTTTTSTNTNTSTKDESAEPVAMPVFSHLGQ